MLDRMSLFVWDNQQPSELILFGTLKEDDYSWDNSTGSGTIDLSGGGQDNGTAIVSPSSSTTYTLTVTNSSGYRQDQVLVDVISAEDATFSLTDFCEGSANSATGIATSGGIFSLNPNPGGGVSINSSTGEFPEECLEQHILWNTLLMVLVQEQALKQLVSLQVLFLMRDLT